MFSLIRFVISTKLFPSRSEPFEQTFVVRVNMSTSLHDWTLAIVMTKIVFINGALSSASASALGVFFLPRRLFLMNFYKRLISQLTHRSRSWPRILNGFSSRARSKLWMNAVITCRIVMNAHNAACGLHSGLNTFAVQNQHSTWSQNGEGQVSRIILTRLLSNALLCTVCAMKG